MSDEICLKNILNKKRIFLVEDINKTECLKKLTNILAKEPEVHDEAELEKEIFKREELMSTGIGAGIGIPHVRLNSISNLIMAVCISRNETKEYISLDNKPINFVFMIISSFNQHTQYIKTLSILSSKLKDDDFKEKLITAANSDSVFNLLIN